MSEFDKNWQACVARARASEPADESAPFGFASRVVARALRTPGLTVAPDDAWQRLSWRTLAVLTAVLVICAAIEVPHFNDRQPMNPGIENTVAQIIWSL